MTLLRAPKILVSAAPTPTQFRLFLSDFEHHFGRFQIQDFSPVSGCPALCVKAFAPHPSHTTLISYSFSAYPHLAATTGRFYRAFASYD